MHPSASQGLKGDVTPSKRNRLADKRYQAALAGLVMAQHEAWSLDVSGDEFEYPEALGRALRATTSLQALNGLTVKDGPKKLKNLRELIKKSSRSFACLGTTIPEPGCL